MVFEKGQTCKLEESDVKHVEKNRLSSWLTCAADLVAKHAARLQSVYALCIWLLGHPQSKQVTANKGRRDAQIE